MSYEIWFYIIYDWIYICLTESTEFSYTDFDKMVFRGSRVRLLDEKEGVVGSFY